KTELRTSQDRYLAAAGHAREGAFAAAANLLKQVTREEPGHFAAWYLLGNCCLDGFEDQAARTAEAVGHYTACIALRPAFHGAWFNRGLAYLRLREFERAEADFTRALELRETLAAALTNRALARENLAATLRGKQK